jgi:hypothetical protein
MLDVRLSDGALAGQGVQAAVCQRRPHDGQVVTSHRHGTLLKIQFQRFFNMCAHHPEIEHQVSDGAISMSCESF